MPFQDYRRSDGINRQALQSRKHLRINEMLFVFACRRVEPSLAIPRQESRCLFH